MLYKKCYNSFMDKERYNKNVGSNCRASLNCSGCDDVLFRKVVIPSMFGDDRKFPPMNGAYTNALVEYEANNALYLYSSDGIYTKLNIPSGVTSVNDKTGDVILDIPSKTSQLDNDAGFITKNVDDLTYYSKTSSFGEVAFSNSYRDLDDKPRIGDGRLTINRNGSTIGYFTANTDEQVNVNISVPVSTSELRNDSHFVVDDNYVHTDRNFTSELRNKLVRLLDIRELGANLKLTNNVLSVTGLVTDHWQLNGRSASDQHPISAITGLEDALAHAGVNQVYRGDTEPTDENILIWIDTSGAPSPGMAFITSDDKNFITSDNKTFITA